jgi:hypothetical protein
VPLTDLTLEAMELCKYFFPMELDKNLESIPIFD